MAKKKNTAISLSQEDNARVQQVLEHYQQIAGNLHTSADQTQAEAALTEINNMTEAAQMALLNALSKERHSDAADVLSAINELSPMKNVRKEARRSLIRLQEAKIYPQWNPPVQQPLATQVTTTPLQFWKGFVTDTRASGVVQLVLCFQEAETSRQARVLGFFLDFLHDGVKEFFTRVDNKGSIDELAAELMKLPDVETKPCSLARGRRLLLEALAVNQEHGTLPNRDYRLNASLINRLVLEAPNLDEEDEFEDEDEFEEEDDFDSEEEEEESLDLHDLSPNEVVVNFVESWVDGDYELAYDLLSSDSPIRKGLSKDDWVERREAWADEALPDDLEPNFIHEREPQKPRLWLPNPLSIGRTANRKEFDVGWSIELDEAASDDILPELPQATAIYEETDRHWFWTSYTLVQEEDAWRIQSITDEGTNAMSLPVAELQKRIQEHNDRMEEFAQKYQPTDPDALHQATELLWRLMQSVYYHDALLKQLPLDRSIYEEAAAPLILFGLYERSLVYLEPLAQRFDEKRAETLRALAAVYVELSEKYLEQDDDERAERFQELAEKTLRESLDIEDSFVAHISLAELLIDENERLDEAEEHLHRARALTSDASDEAHIELHLGEIAMEREQYEQALSHYQRIAEIEPDSPDSWSNIAQAYKKLENFAEAEANYRRAIELQPDDADLYYALSTMYMENNQPEEAIEVIEEGLVANPDSAVLTAYLGSMYLENGDYRQAELFLDKAEELDPDLEVVQIFRQVLKFTKSMQRYNDHKQITSSRGVSLPPPRSGKAKKKKK
jgi:tetratricopeptide (TPR) repeat protein